MDFDKNIFSKDFKPYDWNKQPKITFDEKNLVLKQELDIKDMLLKNISDAQNNLFRRFCRDVCEKTVAQTNRFTHIDEFSKAFDDAFKEVEKEWKK